VKDDDSKLQDDDNGDKLNDDDNENSSVLYYLYIRVHRYHFKHIQVRSSPHLHSLPELSMHYHVEQNKPLHIEAQ
jgi:hypothetical protein